MGAMVWQTLYVFEWCVVHILLISPGAFTSATFFEVCSLGPGSLPVRRVLERPDPHRQALELRHCDTQK